MTNPLARWLLFNVFSVTIDRTGIAISLGLVVEIRIIHIFNATSCFIRFRAVQMKHGNKESIKTKIRKTLGGYWSTGDISCLSFLTTGENRRSPIQKGNAAYLQKARLFKCRMRLICEGYSCKLANGL